MKRKIRQDKHGLYLLFEHRVYRPVPSGAGSVHLTATINGVPTSLYTAGGLVTTNNGYSVIYVWPFLDTQPAPRHCEIWANHGKRYSWRPDCWDPTEEYLRTYIPPQPVVETPAVPATRYLLMEYDLQFVGGNYGGVGQFALVPVARVDAVGAHQAFQEETQIDPCHIIHWSADEVYDEHGNLLET